MNLDEALRRNQARFHCDLCGQPLPRSGSTHLSYEYDGQRTSFKACPTCLTAKALLPEPAPPGVDASRGGGYHSPSRVRP